MELKHINGRKLIELLNSKEDDIEDIKDETCHYAFEYEEEYIDNNRFVLDFTIDSDYVIRGNSIYIQADGSVECVLNEPFDSGGQYDEIEDIVKVYLKQLEIDIRDNKIDVTLGNDLDERSKLKNSIMSTLKDLNLLVSEDSDGDSDLFRLRDLDANLKTSLNRFEKDLNKV
jgi:hypothetical protein